MLVFDITNHVPRIYGVDFTDLNHHAYLVHNEIVYNEGVTWPTPKYPNFSFNELKISGHDFTLNVLNEAIEAYKGDHETLGFKRLGLIIANELPRYSENMTQFYIKTKKRISRDEYYGHMLDFALQIAQKN